MCGIAGYQVIEGQAFDERLKIALPVMTMFMRERGKHSWGWTNGTDIVKNVGDVAETFSSEVQGHSTSLLHTRHATTGDKTAENSHPFKIGGILGVHNGMIYNHATIANKYDYAHEVDSEVIFHHLNAGRDMSELNGYGAVVFFENGKIHLSRFNNGSLILARMRWGWVWASTAEAVNTAFRMAGIQDAFLHQVDLKEGKLYRLDGPNIVKDRGRRMDIGKSGYSSSHSSVTSGGYSGQRTYGSTSYYHGETGYDPSKKQMWDTLHKRWVDRPENDDKYRPSFMNNQGEMYSWDEEKRLYIKKEIPALKQLPLPTAETTTFKSEPSSDYDDVVDTEDDSVLWCGRCGEEFSVEAQHAEIDGEEVCSNCYFEDAVYRFDEFSVDDAERVFGDFKIAQCEDCQGWSLGVDKIYVEQTDKFAVCEYCYRRNYAVDDGEDEAIVEFEPAAFV